MPTPLPPLTAHRSALTPSFTAPPPHEVTHARLVSALVHVLFGLGFRHICTDRISTTLPACLDGAKHCPDVIARSGHDARSLFSVETSTSLRSEGAALRLHALAAMAGSDTLWLAVPHDARAEATRRLRDLHIPARVIGV